MILSKKLSEAFNAQVNAEMWSSNLYLSMSVHFQKLGLNGFANRADQCRSYCMGQRHRIIRTCLQTRMLRFRTDRQNGRYRRRR